MWWFNLGHVGLALATAIAAWANAGMLYRGLRRDAILSLNILSIRWLMQIASGTLAMMLVIWWMLPELSVWTVWPWWQRALQLGLLCASGFAVFVLVLWLSGVRLADLRH